VVLFIHLAPLIVISTPDAPSNPRCGIRLLIMGAYSFQEAVRKVKSPALAQPRAASDK
jgi:hypothetical protein